MSTRKSQSSLPPVRPGQASSGAPAEESPLLSRLLEVQAEIAALADKGEVEGVMGRIATRGQELSGAAGAALGVIERGEVVCRAATGSISRAVGEKLVEASLWSRSARALQVMRSDDTELDSRVDRATCRRLGARSLVMAPLLCGERLCGVLFVLSPRPGAFGEGEEKLVSMLARGGGPLLAHAEAARVAVEREREVRALREQVRRREAELEGVLQALDAPVYLVSEGGAVRANRAALELLGVDSAQALKGPPAALAERLHARLPDTQARVEPGEDPLARALTGVPWTRDMVVRHARGGQDVLVRGAGVPVRVDIAVIGAVVALTEVGAHSRAEEQKDQFLSLVERASDCIGITSLTGRPVYLNAAGRGLLGFENLEVFRATPVLDTYLAEDREAARQAFVAVRERGRWEGELRLYNRRTGEARPVWQQLFTLVARETGRAVAVGAVTKDLSEHQRAESVRERLMELIGTDLRAPLSAIAVAASSLLRRGALTEADTKAAGRIAQGAERMGQLVGQVLDFTRVYLGEGLVPRRSRVDLDTLARDVVATVELEHPERQVRYVSRGDARGQWDRERLGELLSLLLEHALKASPAGLPVELRVSGEGDEVRVEVHRMGAPLAPEAAARLFDAFRPPVWDEAGQEPGGLGLFVTRAIARAHGGEVEVRSSAAEGTVLRARLPRGPGARP